VQNDGDDADLQSDSDSKPSPRSLYEMEGRAERHQERKTASRPLFDAVRDVDRDTYAKERQAREEEVRLHRELAIELVNLGYKAMAMRLHPDRGGSKDAMARLNRVRAVLL